MFSWLKFGKKTIPTTHDKVWKSQIIKWKNIEKEYSQDNAIFWVAFFPNTYYVLTKLFGEQKNIWLVGALETSLHLNEFDFSAVKQIHFVEHHPFFSVENSFLKTIYQFNAQIKDVYFYTSLQDNLLQKFGSQNIISILEKMGFQEDEMLQHSLIVNSIQQAQKKLENNIKSEEEKKLFLEDWQKLM